MIKTFKDSHWSGEVEINAGELGSIMADCEIDYDTDGNSWRMGSYKVTASMDVFTSFGKDYDHDHQIDLTNRISQKAIEDIFEQYIVQEQL